MIATVFETGYDIGVNSVRILVNVEGLATAQDRPGAELSPQRGSHIILELSVGVRVTRCSDVSIG
jgi:hypothetical protein